MKFKNKKVISAMICLFVTLILSINNMCYANINDNEIIDINETKKQAIETVSKNIENLKLNSRIGLIFDRNSKRILYKKNGLKQVPMASTTKIMTAIVVLENSELNDVVTISKKAAGTGGSRLGLRTNDKITVHDLLYGLMLKSGNDAAVALAEHVGGGIEEFADMMNKKAKELGLINSHFIFFARKYTLFFHTFHALHYFQFHTFEVIPKYSLVFQDRYLIYLLWYNLYCQLLFLVWVLLYVRFW